MVYAFVIHARFVPALRGRWIYNVMSVLAFASILMTYFGVNFHLSGLHSYASGEKQNVTYYFVILAIVLVISAIAYFPYKKYYKKLGIFFKSYSSEVKLSDEVIKDYSPYILFLIG